MLIVVKDDYNILNKKNLFFKIFNKKKRKIFQIENCKRKSKNSIVKNI